MTAGIDNHWSLDSAGSQWKLGRGKRFTPVWEQLVGPDPKGYKATPRLITG
jgi:hypothetical protein